MAPRKMKSVAPKTETGNKLRVDERVVFKRVKAEMGKLIDDQECIREEQRKTRVKLEEIERQCDQLREETDMILKQTAGTQFKLVLMFKILRARQAGNFIGAAIITQCLRAIVARERAIAMLQLAKVKDEDL